MTQPNTRVVRILSAGMYAFPTERRKPYYVTLDLNGDGKGVPQPMTADQFFDFVNSLFVPRLESCGETHVPTATVPT